MHSRPKAPGAESRSRSAAEHSGPAQKKSKPTPTVPDCRPVAQQLAQLVALANPSTPSQGFAHSSTPNHTGLPDSLKSGIESLSGQSLDHVRVHRNSSKPAQLNAHAFAQGSDIHLASGQEKHLPHEAWHVVQQAQGRVKPTLQAKGVAINDDRHLEHEADTMGAKALAQTKPVQRRASARQPAVAPVVQRALDDEERRELNAGFIAANWTAAPARMAFRAFADHLSDTAAWTVDELLPLIPLIEASEFVAVRLAVGDDALQVMLGNRMLWTEIKLYSVRDTPAQFAAAYQGYIHGAHVGSFTHFATTLAGHADAALGVIAAAGVDPFDPVTCLATLQATYPAPNVFVRVGTQITINNEITLAARKIKDLPTAALADIVAHTRALADPAAGAAAKAAARVHMTGLGGSRSQRFRYPANAAQALAFLQPLVPAGGQAAFAALWAAADDRAKLRAYDLWNNYHTVPSGAVHWKEQAAQYASSRNAGTLLDFVNFFEFYMAYLDHEVRDTVDWYYDIVRELTAADHLPAPVPLAGAQARAAHRAFGDAAHIPANAERARRFARARVGQGTGGAVASAAVLGTVADIYADYESTLVAPAAPAAGAGAAAVAAHAAAVLRVLPNAIGPRALPAGEVSPRTRGAQIVAIAATLGFGSASAAAYHAAKHSAELPADQRNGNDPLARMTDYLASARNAVAHGAWSYRVDQTGNESHYFAQDGMRAIVAVNPAAPSAVIATYFTG